MAVYPMLNSRMMIMITCNWKRHAFAAVLAGTAIAAACSASAAPVLTSTAAVKQALLSDVQDVRWGRGGGWRGGWGGWLAGRCLCRRTARRRLDRRRDREPVLLRISNLRIRLRLRISILLGLRRQLSVRLCILSVL